MSDSLRFNPFNGKPTNQVLGVRTCEDEENRTPVIPDEVMEPLCNNALNYVFIYSNDIFNARDQLESTRQALEASGKYATETGLHGRLVFRNSPLSRGRAALGQTNITKMIDGEPWREPFNGVLDLYKEETRLFTACYIVIAWLTGMRDSELTSLRENCLRRELSEDGVIERAKIKGTLFKGVPDPKGREETWVTIEPAAKAIEVLKRLTERLRVRAGGKFTELFLRGERARNVVIASNELVNVLLREFAKHSAMPLVDGTPWQLSSRQFRRTLARWIARRPFGETAGMIQFKHLHIATFEGYAGRDPEFRKELDEEKLLANLDLLQELQDEFIEGTVAGPKSSELGVIFRGIAGDRRPDDEKYMLRHLAKILYVGMFNLCFYEAEHAACQHHLPIAERKAPITSHCQPDKCQNSCITKRHHLGRWQSRLEEIKRLLKAPKLPTPQRLALEQERGEIERVIEPLISGAEEN